MPGFWSNTCRRSAAHVTVAALLRMLPRQHSSCCCHPKDWCPGWQLCNWAKALLAQLQAWPPILWLSTEEECCLCADPFSVLRNGKCNINIIAAGSVCGSSQKQYTTLTVCLMYRHPDRGQVAGILEVIQTSEDMVFSDLVEILSQVLTRPLLWLLVQVEAAMQLCSIRLLVPPMLQLQICGAAELWLYIIHTVCLILHAMPCRTCTV